MLGLLDLLVDESMEMSARNEISQVCDSELHVSVNYRQCPSLIGDHCIFNIIHGHVPYLTIFLPKYILNLLNDHPF